MKTYNFESLGHRREDDRDEVVESKDGLGEWVKVEDFLAWRKDALTLIAELRSYAISMGGWEFGGDWDIEIERLKGEEG